MKAISIERDKAYQELMDEILKISKQINDKKKQSALASLPKQNLKTSKTQNV